MNDLHSQRMKAKEKEAEQFRLEIEFNKFRKSQLNRKDLE